jgi:hypothetical protein
MTNSKALKADLVVIMGSLVKNQGFNGEPFVEFLNAIADSIEDSRLQKMYVRTMRAQVDTLISDKARLNLNYDGEIERLKGLMTKEAPTKK